MRPPRRREGAGPRARSSAADVPIEAKLVVAGLIEGSFSQFSAKTVPYPLKIAVAVALDLGLLADLFVPRRGDGV